MENTYIRVISEENMIKLDPRSKILILLLMNIMAFTTDTWYIMALLGSIPLSLLVLNKRYLLAFFCGLIYAISLLAYVFMLDTGFTILSIIVAMITSVICRMGPGLLMGYYLLTTTTVSELISSMERMHLPNGIIIPISVMFRFFPTIKEEASSINDAMRMRGIQLGKSKDGLIAVLEYRLVPLLISTVKIGEELSCSALTRGLGSSGKRTNICKIGFGITDMIYIVFVLAVFTLFIFTKGV
ncbi:energy-coupling factor transporter transmembrane component T [Senegalia sp. (in: firmicutes)]|uniref:energy-coupling factor transporter transmembrane component T n=1 Tax=Senegalia sp. (in: firmicutes) TaxID=1924098 RepID=UPI003F9DFC53